MRPAVIAVLALAGCSSQRVERIGPYQYTVIARPKQVSAKAWETCAKLGRPLSSEGIPLSDNVVGVRYWHAHVECFLPYEVVPITKNSYKIWVPGSEFRRIDACESCVQPDPQARVEQLATDYCAKMSMTLQKTGGDFDLGTGLNTIFICVPAGASP